MYIYVHICIQIPQHVCMCLSTCLAACPYVFACSCGHLMSAAMSDYLSDCLSACLNACLSSFCLSCAPINLSIPASTPLSTGRRRGGTQKTTQKPQFCPGPPLGPAWRPLVLEFCSLEAPGPPGRSLSGGSPNGRPTFLPPCLPNPPSIYLSTYKYLSVCLSVYKCMSLRAYWVIIAVDGLEFVDPDLSLNLNP